jgi:GR25 family glycosyltransferase involved in LPS biosynthesis
MIPIFVINLPYKPDRRERLGRHLVETGLVREVSEIRWVRAVSGSWCQPPHWWRSGGGAWGCLMSHLRIVQDAVMDGLESCMVLEDDAVFQPRAVELLGRLLREAPEDWDQLYLGGQHLREPEAVEGRPYVLRCRNVNRTHGFILRRRAFVKFQQHIMHAPDYLAHTGWHIDHQLGRAHERGDWKVYAPAWWICGQEAGTSNISGRENPRYWWHPARYSRLLPYTVLPALPDAELTARLHPHLHCGWQCAPGSFADTGLAEAVGCPERLRDWLVQTARESLDMEKLPGLCHPALTAERVSALWPAGARAAAAAPVEDWAGYPWNGLFPHPLNEGPPVAGAVRKRNAA